MEDLLEFMAHQGHVWSGIDGEREGGLAAFRFYFVAQLDAGAGDGEAVFIEKLLDADHGLDVALAIHALAGAALDGFELGKFGLPEAKDVGGKAAQAGHFADAEIELVRE